MAARSNRQLFMIDLGMPRNIAASVTHLYNVYLYDMDDLSEIVEQNKRAREAEIPRVEAIVDQHVEKFEVWQASVETGAVLGELRTRLQELDVDPGRLEQVEQRLQLLADLERRYGELDGLGARADEARAALAELDAGGGRIEQLERAEAEAADRARGCSDQLRKLRRKAAPALGRAVEAELAQLGMAGAAFRVVLEPADLSPHGSDRAVLELAANPGLPAGPLADVGSGGELSRVALALRVAARAPGGPGVLLLDEVDAGVGGRTARAVGEKLQELSLSAQVLCITHLPQIASLADANFHVAKELGDPSAATIVRLEGEQVVDELARMLGGDAGDDAARAHAASLRG